MDIKCVVCGEPWDAWGVNHGDMAAWEARLFKLGSGCPCCEGIGDFEPKTISDIENGDDDPILRLNAWEDKQDGKAPKWEKPKPIVFWECDGCGVQVIGDPELPENHEDYLQYHTRPGTLAYNCEYGSHKFHTLIDIEKEPHHTFENGVKVCPFCHNVCEGCGADLALNVEFGDMYNEGLPFYANGDSYFHEPFCYDCFSSLCKKCERLPDDCTCCHECDKTEWDCTCNDEDNED